MWTSWSLRMWARHSSSSRIHGAHQWLGEKKVWGDCLTAQKCTASASDVTTQHNSWNATQHAA